MIDPSDYQQAGFADPSGRGRGFFIPVFSQRKLNALLVEHVGASGSVESLVPLDPQETPIIQGGSGKAVVGTKPHWAFGFSRDDVVSGQGDEGRSILQSRLTTLFIAQEPFLAFEIADFLGLRDPRLESARIIFEDLRSSTQGIAEQWRDLAVLSPDIRQDVANLLADLRLPIPSLKQLVARHRSGVLEIRGFDFSHYSNLKDQISDCVRSTFRRLAPLYRDVDPRATIRWLSSSGKDKTFKREVDDAINYQALLFISDDALAAQAANDRRIALARIMIFQPNQHDAFLRRSLRFRGPTFVAFKLTSPMPEVLRDRHQKTENKTVNLAIQDQLPAPELLGLFRDLERLDEQTIVIPSRDKTFWLSYRNISSELVDAIGLVMENWREDLFARLPGKVCFFFRAKGTRPNRATDAWADIYGKCKRLGIEVRRGAFFQSTADSSFYQSERPAIRIFFPNVKSDRIRPTSFGSGRRTFDAAALITPNRMHEGPYSGHHSEVIAELLQSQGWRVSLKSRTQAEMEIRGRRRPAQKFRVSIIENDDDSRRTTYPVQWLQTCDLESIDEIAVSEYASTGAILNRLFSRKALTVNARDLALFPAGYGTIWDLLASQLRRFTSSFLSRTRSNYLALLLSAATRQKSQGRSQLGEARAAIDHALRDDHAYLVCSKTTFEVNRMYAEIRLLRSIGAHPVSSDNALVTIPLTISNRGAEIQSITK